LLNGQCQVQRILALYFLLISLGILLIRQYRVESGKLRQAGTQGLQAVQLINTD
jgi:hypothetical protein